MDRSAKQRNINPFPNKPWFLRVCRTSLLKTLWEKEKLLVTSNFCFSHSVFYPFLKLFTIFIKFEIVVCKVFQFGAMLNLSFGKGLNSFVLKAFAYYNSNAAQIIGFGIHKLKYCRMRRKYWFPAILYNSTLTLKAFIGFIDISEELCLNIICFLSLWKKTIFSCMNVLYLRLH